MLECDIVMHTKLLNRYQYLVAHDIKWYHLPVSKVLTTGPC